MEQYLFLIEKMVPFFSYSQGKKLFSVFGKLVEQGTISQEGSLNIEKSEKLNSMKTIDKLENNFLIYSISPVKD